MDDKSKEYKNMYNAARWKRLKDSGLCITCGKINDTSYNNCTSCRSHINELRKQMYERRYKLGLCINCGEVNTDTNFKQCFDCRARNSARKSAWYKNKLANKGGETVESTAKRLYQARTKTRTSPQNTFKTAFTRGEYQTIIEDESHVYSRVECENAYTAWDDRWQNEFQRVEDPEKPGRILCILGETLLKPCREKNGLLGCWWVRISGSMVFGYRRVVETD